MKHTDGANGKGSEMTSEDVREIGMAVVVVAFTAVMVGLLWLLADPGL